MSKLDHFQSPQSVSLAGRNVKVSSYRNLVNSKLKAFYDRQESKDIDDLEFLVNKGKNKYRVDDLDQRRVKFFCENYPVEHKSDKKRRKKKEA